MTGVPMVFAGLAVAEAIPVADATTAVPGGSVSFRGALFAATGGMCIAMNGTPAVLSADGLAFDSLGRLCVCVTGATVSGNVGPFATDSVGRLLVADGAAAVAGYWGGVPYTSTGALVVKWPWAVDATGAQIRTAMLNPANYVTNGWVIDPTSGARILANARASVAMQQTVAGTWEFAPHNLTPWAEDISNAQWNPIGGASKTGGNSFTLAGNFTSRVESAVTVGVGVTVTFAVLISGTPGVQVDLRVLDNGGGFPSTTTLVTLSATPTLVSVTRSGVTQAQVAVGVVDRGTACSVTMTQCRLCYGPSAAAYVPTTTAAVYAPAIDWISGIGYGVRSEEARTNLLTWSTNMANAAWADRAVVTVTANAATAPDGTLTAASVTKTGAGSTYTDYGQQVTVGAGVNVGRTYTYSVWAWVASGTQTIRLQISDVNFATDQSAALTVTTTPTRFTFTSSGGAGWNASGTQIAGGLLLPTGTAVFLWGGQLEVGSFPTSPILTYGAAATRAADIPIIGYTVGATGTVIADFVRPAIYVNNARVIGTNGAGDTSGFEIAPSTAVINSWDNASTVSTANATTANVVQRAALSWDASNRSLCLNGGTVATGAHGGTLATVSQWVLGADDSGAASLNGWNIRARLMQQRLPNATMQALAA